jgi:hypothetical protein
MNYAAEMVSEATIYIHSFIGLAKAFDLLGGGIHI